MAPPPLKVAHFAILIIFSSIPRQAFINNIDASSPDYGDQYWDVAHNWLNHGGDIHNRRYASRETEISPSTAPGLRLKWKFFVGNSVSATPAIYEGILYFTSWNGYMYAVRAHDGSLVWAKNVKELTGISAPGRNTTVARSTPTVVLGHDMLILGMTGPAYVFAVRRSTGDFIWSTLLDTHPLAVITMSGTYYDGGFYVGVSSLEEGLPIDQCCTFRGSFVKLDARTGHLLWQTFILPDNHGKLGEYAGAAIWGSSPSIDTKRNLVYIATGNLYTVPESVQRCQERLNNQTAPPKNPNECIDPNVHSESMLALEIESGKIRWSKQLGGYDVWFGACSNSSTPNCPTGPNPDADFGEEPMILSVYIEGAKQDVVTAVQKSGFAWTLDRDNGDIIWFTEAGPGGPGGGGTWGAATDTRMIYTNIANSNRLNFTLKPSTNVTRGGGWVGMDTRTGQIKWSTAEPKEAITGPVTVANGVLFGGSTALTGPLYAIDAATGEILWSYDTEAIVFGGASVSDGCIYVGHGYREPYSASVGTYVFAFCTNQS